MIRVIAPELLYLEGTFRDGRAVVIDESGTVCAVEEASLHPEAVRLAGRAMLPGLVNTHSHAFQRVIRGGAEEPSAAPGDFWSWRGAMYRAANRLNPEDIYRVSRMAFLEMALSGITTVGEFHYLHRDPQGAPYSDRNLLSRLVVQAAREVGLRICLLRTAYFRAGFRKPPNPLQRRFIEPGVDEFLSDTEALRTEFNNFTAWVGVAPHSIRAVPMADIHAISAWANHAGVPVHMHVAEQPGELEACQSEFGVTPVALLAREGLLHSRFTGVHAIHITQDEIVSLARSGATVCACPTTERNLGDGIVPSPELLTAGVPIALGSDSQAQIDLLEEARELEYHARLRHLRRGLISPKMLLQSATGSGAHSLGVAERAADFFTVDLNDLSIAGSAPEKLVAAILFGLRTHAVKDVIVGGEFIVRDGRHPQETAIFNDYLRVPQ